MRRISLNRYDVISYLDEFEDHCLTLKNAPHAILTCVAYETLVNEEDQACSTPDTPHTLLTHGVSLSRFHQIWSKTAKGHAPHTKNKLRRIWRRCTNIPEYINLGPHTKLSRCAASIYSMRRIDLSDRNYKYPKTIRILETFCKTLKSISEEEGAGDTPETQIQEL